MHKRVAAPSPQLPVTYKKPAGQKRVMDVFDYEGQSLTFVTTCLPFKCLDRPCSDSGGVWLYFSTAMILYHYQSIEIMYHITSATKKKIFVHSSINYFQSS